MNTLILQTATRHLRPVLLVFALWLLWRGHNAPGGGFIAGLVAGGSVVLHAVTFGPDDARRLMRAPPRIWIAVGLALALGAGLAGLVFGEALLDALWLDVPGIGPLGTPLIFDVGVFAAVIGVVAEFTLSLWPAVAADAADTADTAEGG